MPGNDDSAVLDALNGEGLDAMDSSQAMRSILQLIDLLPVQEPPPELVDSTLRRVSGEAEPKN